ncbi:MAG TPA: DEAD/DEAH box helicase, partial [Solirubrobacteraceae bacterium]|nr:DEAD/DEAH box helicase [Solirubrobacteraceae bacterium]
QMLTPPGCDPPREAWAMVAAVLGSRARNKAFVSRFWWEGLRDVLERASRVSRQRVNAEGEDTEPGERTHAEREDTESAPAPSWEQAVARFREALACVEKSQAERVVYGDLLDAREDAVAELMAERIGADGARVGLDEIELELAERREAARVAVSAVARCVDALRAHESLRPSAMERVRTFGGAIRAWRLRRARLSVGLEAAEQAASETRVRLEPVQARAAELTALLERHEERRRVAEARARELQVEIPTVRERFATDFPDAVMADERWAEPAERERRERCAPWIDSDYNTARVELFLAALALHRAFIEAAAPKMRASLRCATELISGQAGSDVSPQAARAAWQCLFLAVPLVSTTFASFPYLFRHLGQEDLGWLLIDEAGQATPQAAVGAIWRSRRVVVVGDPLQLEPIVQLPRSIERVLRAEHRVERSCLPGDASVQTLADQVCQLGTYRACSGEGLQSLWVGIPLNVHRRCESPMFEIVNEVAYGGQMLNCTPEREELRLAGSHWIDVPGAPSSGNWVAAEGVALEQLLDGLRYEMVDFSEVFLITPFRAVARNIAKYRKSYAGLTAGTIHTAQGREAEIVILVLGGDSRRPGARAWAAQKPNLLNVAVSRARRRLYVIGDREAWSRLEHFDVLAACLEPVVLSV